MTIQFGWGWRIALLYSAFVAMILVLVISSSKQKFDLVSPDYYKDEIAYQTVVDASENQAALTGSLIIQANKKVITIDFPNEFSEIGIQGDIYFYSAVNKNWDRHLAVKTMGNRMEIDRSLFMKTSYKIKLSYSANGKKYYQENDINLSK